MEFLPSRNTPGWLSLHCSRHCLWNRRRQRTRASAIPLSSPAQMAHVCPPSPVSHPGLCSGSPALRTPAASP
eukprot:2792806-Pyramimonas_sp.AAC.1